MRLLIITTVLFFSFSATAQAAEWLEISSDTYIDKSSYKYNPETKTARMWTKMLKSKQRNMKNINGKKVQFKVRHDEFDCVGKQLKVLSGVSYDSQSNVLDSYDNPYKDYPTSILWSTIVPESIGEDLYKVACHPYFEKD